MADSLYIFTNDLRVNDNPQLQSLIAQHQKGELSLRCAYIFDPTNLKPTNFTSRPMGPFRLLFLLQSLQNLASSIIKQGIPFDLVVNTVSEGIASLLNLETETDIKRKTETTANAYIFLDSY